MIHRYRKAITAFMVFPLLFCLLYSYAISGPVQVGHTPCSQRQEGTIPVTSVQHCNPVLASADQRDIKPIQTTFQPVVDFRASFSTVPSSTLPLHPPIVQHRRDIYLQNHTLRI